MFKLLMGVAIGAAAAWFLDPNDGARRRRVLQDMVQSYARPGTEHVATDAGWPADAVEEKGPPAPTAGLEPPAEPLSDPALEAKVQREVFRECGVPRERVALNVEDGVVYLRGEVEDESVIDSMGQAARKVDGVRGVENLLHTPGAPSRT
jgi:osmotically-inducible protein OsmY